MEPMSTTHTATAIRTFSANGKATIVATIEVDGKTFTRKLSGTRAAAAVVVIATPNWGHVAFGCRSDRATAEAEAHRVTTATEMRTRQGVVRLTPVAWAEVIEIVDAWPPRPDVRKIPLDVRLDDPLQWNP